MINPALNMAAPVPSAQNNGQPQVNAQATAEFSAVLAKKMGDKAVADKSTPPGKPADNDKTTKTGKTAADQTAQDQSPQTAVTDPANNPFAALFLGTQTLKKDPAASADAKSGKEQTSQTTDVSISPIALPVNPELKVATTVGTESATSAVKSTSSAVSARQSGVTREKTDQAVSIAGKSEPAASVKTADISVALKTTDLAASMTEPSTQAQTVIAQIAPTPTPNVTANNAPTTIAAPVGSSAWPAEFSQKISWMSTQQTQVAELHLNPPDLGPMSVVLTISDNQATAMFSSPHSAVREAIENAMPKLRESMADNGIMLGNATVSDQPPRDRGASDSMNQRANSRADDASSTRADTPQTMTPLTSTRRHNGMVDTFA